jgi:hypothetical protein
LTTSNAANVVSTALADDAESREIANNGKRTDLAQERWAKRREMEDFTDAASMGGSDCRRIFGQCGTKKDVA